MRALTLLALSAPLVLGACATASDAGPRQAAAAPRRAVDLRPAQDVDVARTGGSAYGLFLAGQAALNDGRADRAADYFSRAERAERAGVEAGELDDQTFVTSLLAGDIARAATLAPQGEGANASMERLGRLVRVVDALAADKPKVAKAVLAEGPIGPPHRRVGVLVTPFISAATGDTEGSVVMGDPRGDRVVDVFGHLGQAQLYERARRYDEAETNYKALNSSATGLFPLEYGAFLERRRRFADAVAVYDAALARNPADLEVQAAKARAAARRKAPPAPTLKQGAARALIAASAGAMAERQAMVAQAYLQLALRLDPGRDEALMLLGDVLADASDPEAARAAYARIPATSSAYAAARAKLAWTYQAAGEHDAAIRMAQEMLKAAPADRTAAMTLADLLRANERYAESAAVLNTVMDAGQPVGEADWRLLYMRGIALERAGRSADAEKDLEAALAMRPDEPELLNYLGYMWIDRGVNLDRAQAMIEKALATNPRSGAMIDSLAWAYYRRGDYKTAVEKLEQAVELEPADPDINDHLGDAYWRVGRRIEAQFQWRRVLTLEPDSRRKAEAEAKLANGLGPNGPAVRPTIAGR